MPGRPAVIFDLGGVVLGWDPAPAYAEVMPAHEVPAFLDLIGFAAWNWQQDAGRSFADGEAELISRFPEHEAAIVAYRRNFARTLTGPVPGTAAVIAELAQSGVRLFALTNWSAETVPHALERFGILERFEQILVSGAEGVAKPDPAVFRLALERFGLPAAGTVFVDDMARNVRAATSLGLTAVEFRDAELLRADLCRLGMLAPRVPVTEPVFHVADRAAWARAEAGQRYPWSSRGLSYDSAGFVHGSFQHQVPQVLDGVFGDVDRSELALLELDTSRLLVVVEDLGAGPFPHVFTELTPGAVLRVHRDSAD